MKTKIFAMLALFLVFSGVGCKKFLEVDPKSTMGEDQIFSSEVGFQQALIGLYSQMASRQLYGDNLTMGFTSMIAQNYSPTISSVFSFKQTVALNFKGTDAIPLISGIWTQAYTTIAGANNILEKIEQKQGVFTGDNYALVKGETIGLRAYLHFDLLRLFGANFATNPGKKSIPYRDELNALSKVPSTVDEVSAMILADLKIAEALMKGKDPIRNNKSRRFKMNYYAIKALQARVYLFRGDKENAAAAATEVVNSGVFTLAKSDQLNAASGRRDRTFSTEQVFAIRVRDIKDWAIDNREPYFKLSNSNRNYLTRTNADFLRLYENSSTDVRYTKLIEAEAQTYFCTKYWQTWIAANVDGKLETEADRLDQTVPLMRLSEMYYILAETAATADQGLIFLNLVRDARVIPIIPAGIASQRLSDEIMKEYQKDFYAEGQLFYYYKRKLSTRMLFSTKNLTEANYIVPVPENELEFNPNYN
ncbi:RagB/SusD family nutrient uptake outer membrane protein [Pedobacter nyackensis]|uniref:RagB/SusD family nutrient uptake outer membrane protein n=1 Tax=Pedobacter nyackensis TaxID=475255 RepID=UPI00292EABA2|nr:RagB/SusD family nutrient uptake outer membrane protein [Pedobacter nyackensis]